MASKKKDKPTDEPGDAPQDATPPEPSDQDVVSALSSGAAPTKKDRSKLGAARRVAQKAAKVAAETKEATGVTELTPEEEKVAVDVAKKLTAKEREIERNKAKVREANVKIRERMSNRLLKNLPPERATQVVEARERTKDILRNLRPGRARSETIESIDPSGTALEQVGIDRADQAKADSINYLLGMINAVPTGPGVDAHTMVMHLLSQGFKTPEAQKRIYGDIFGSHEEGQRAMEFWGTINNESFSNPDFMHRDAISKASYDPTLLHDEMLKNPVIARHYGVWDDVKSAAATLDPNDPDTVISWDPQKLAKFNATRRKVAGIHDFLHKDLSEMGLKDLRDRAESAQSNDLGKFSGIYKQRSNEEFQRLLDEGASVEDAIKGGFEFGVRNVMASAAADREKYILPQEDLRRLRIAESKPRITAGDFIPPITNKPDPSTLSGLSEYDVGRMMIGGDVGVKPSTAAGSVFDYLYQKGKEAEGIDSRPYRALDMPGVDTEGMPSRVTSPPGLYAAVPPEELMKQVLEEAIAGGQLVPKQPNTETPWIQNIEEQGITPGVGRGRFLNPALFGTIASPEVDMGELRRAYKALRRSGVSREDARSRATAGVTEEPKPQGLPNRMPSVHWVQTADGKLIKSSGFAGAGVSALQDIGTVTYISPDHPEYVEPDYPNKSYEQNIVFIEDPSRAKILPTTTGGYTIQHKVTTSPRTQARDPGLPTSVGANVSEMRQNIKDTFMRSESYRGSAKQQGLPNPNLTPDQLAEKSRNEAGFTDQAKDLIEQQYNEAVADERRIWEADRRTSPDTTPTTFRPTVKRISMQDALDQVYSTYLDEQRSQQIERESTPESVAERTQFESDMAKARENDPRIPALENIRDEAGSIANWTNRVHDEVHSFVRKRQLVEDALGVPLTSNMSGEINKHIDNFLQLNSANSGEVTTKHADAIKALVAKKTPASIKTDHGIDLKIDVPESSPQIDNSLVSIQSYLMNKLPIDSPLRAPATKGTYTTQSGEVSGEFDVPGEPMPTVSPEGQPALNTLLSSQLNAIRQGRGSKPNEYGRRPESPTITLPPATPSGRYRELRERGISRASARAQVGGQPTTDVRQPLPKPSTPPIKESPSTPWVEEMSRTRDLVKNTMSSPLPDSPKSNLESEKARTATKGAPISGEERASMVSGLHGALMEASVKASSQMRGIGGTAAISTHAAHVQNALKSKAALNKLDQRRNEKIAVIQNSTILNDKQKSSQIKIITDTADKEAQIHRDQYAYSVDAARYISEQHGITPEVVASHVDKTDETTRSIVDKKLYPRRSPSANLPLYSFDTANVMRNAGTEFFSDKTKSRQELAENARGAKEAAVSLAEKEGLTYEGFKTDASKPPSFTTGSAATIGTSLKEAREDWEKATGVVSSDMARFATVPGVKDYNRTDTQIYMPTGKPLTEPSQTMKDLYSLPEGALLQEPKMVTGKVTRVGIGGTRQVPIRGSITNRPRLTFETKGKTMDMEIPREFPETEFRRKLVSMQQFNPESMFERKTQVSTEQAAEFFPESRVTPAPGIPNFPTRSGRNGSEEPNT